MQLEVNMKYDIGDSTFGYVITANHDMRVAIVPVFEEDINNVDVRATLLKLCMVYASQWGTEVSGDILRA
tara:strand:+ start:6848 stop:7057 length:210 start_codon:yes stop_codon:yes gene_type:complete